MPDATSWPDGSGTEWNVRYSIQFHRQMGTRNFRSDGIRADIRRRINILLADPQRALRSERLGGKLSGLRSARFNRRDRFILKLCKECREFGDESRWPIDCCQDQKPDRSALNILYLSLSHYRDLPDRFELADEPDDD